MSDLEKYQVKSTTPVDEYKCTLSDELRKLAEVELRETEEIRNHGIKAMRDWILNNPRIIKCRMDSIFLLRFLRFRKFSIPMAQEALERYLLFREGLYGYDWFSNLDYDRPYLSELLDKGVIIPLQIRDKFGRQILMYRASTIDPSVNNVGIVYLSLNTLFFEMLLDIEENQIRGLNYLGDVTGLQLAHAQILPLDICYKFGKNIEKTCAARHKGYNIVNMPSFVQYIANLTMKQMPEKLKARVRFYSTIDEVDCIEKKNLPLEYGGKIPISDMIMPWKEKLIEKKEFFRNYSNMKINTKLYPYPVIKCAVDTLKWDLNATEEQTKKYNYENMNGIHGSFRKLEID